MSSTCHLKAGANMLDLDFYAGLPYGALYRESRIHPGIWTWTPNYCLLTYPDTPEHSSQLTEADWLPIGGLDDKTLDNVSVLFSQLGQARLLGTPEQGQAWIPRADYDHLARTPVLLAFTLASAEGQKGTLYVSRTVPPANLGEFGIILVGEGNQVDFKCLRIGCLSRKSQKLQQSIGAALSRLEQRRHLGRVAWLEQWREIQIMARDLARDYWSAYEGTRVERPHVPNVFKDGAAWTGLNMGLQGTQSAIYHAGVNDNWKREPGVLPYHDSKFEHGYTRVWLQDPTQTGVDAEMASEELTKHLAALSDLEADIVTIQIAQAMAAQDGQGEAVLTPEAIQEYRGKLEIAHKEGETVRYSGHRTEDRAEIVAAFERTAWLRLKIQQWVNRTKGGKGKMFEVESAYVLIKEWLRQPTLDDSPPRLIAWRYQMGTWLAPFMDEAEAGRYFGVLMKKTLEYNIKNELVEKRLARYFAIHLCIAAHNGTANIKRYVGKLIDECAMPIDHRNPQRTKDRFEKALGQLVADGIIGDWKYTDNSQLPARQWLENWRGRSIVVTLGPRALEAYQPLLEKAQARRAGLSAPQQNKKQGKRKTV